MYYSTINKIIYWFIIVIIIIVIILPCLNTVQVTSYIYVGEETSRNHQSYDRGHLEYKYIYN